jgi:hypothetical protein
MSTEADVGCVEQRCTDVIRGGQMSTEADGGGATMHGRDEADNEH